MQVSPDEGKFMNMITRIANVKKVVEVGVFTGYSSLAVALALPADGMSVTLRHCSITNMVSRKNLCS